MAWTPERAVIATRAVAENILAYVTDDDRQTDALTWAGGVNYKLVKTIQERKRNPKQPFYPHIQFLDDNDAQVYDDDLINGSYTVKFEIGIQNSDSDDATTQARKYDHAFKSMIVNCPAATLITGTGAVNAVVQGIEAGFLPIQAGQQGTATNDFLQRVQIAVAISIGGGADT